MFRLVLLPALLLSGGALAGQPIESTEVPRSGCPAIAAAMEGPYQVRDHSRPNTVIDITAANGCIIRAASDDERLSMAESIATFGPRAPLPRPKPAR